MIVMLVPVGLAVQVCERSVLCQNYENRRTEHDSESKLVLHFSQVMDENRFTFVWLHV